MAVVLDRPADLFNREHEWATLSEFVSDPTPGLRIGIVYGRRRQGKSFPLRRLASATGGFYYQALEHEASQTLAELGESIGTHLGFGRLALASWEEVISSLGRLAPAKADGPLLAGLPQSGVATSSVMKPSVAILDEFPYLLERSPELPSLLQRSVDRSREENGPAIRLILCGSAISVMANLLEGQGALRGRVHTNLLVRPFGYVESMRFWGLDDPRLAFRVDAIVGGTPGYRELVRSTPSSLADLDSWVVDEVLTPASALFREDEWLLGEQRGMENRALYLSVLASVALGNCTQTSIANQLGRSQQSVLHPLDALVRANLLDKDDDVIRQRRPIYRVEDPIIRFHQVVRHPRSALFEDRRGVEAWADAKQSFESLVLGPHFERLAREYLARRGVALFDVPIVTVGTTVVNDKDMRAAHQLDIVALSPGTGTRNRVIEAIGEAKLRYLDGRDLARLDRIRTLMPEAKGARLVLASASGFSQELIRAAAARSDVRLVGLEELYSDDQ